MVLSIFENEVLRVEERNKPDSGAEMEHITGSLGTILHGGAMA
jgi:hypothetical protein